MLNWNGNYPSRDILNKHCLDFLKSMADCAANADSVANADYAANADNIRNMKSVPSSFTKKNKTILFRICKQLVSLAIFL